MAVNILERATNFNGLGTIAATACSLDLGECPEVHHIATVGDKLIVNQSNRIIRRTGRYQGMLGYAWRALVLYVITRQSPLMITFCVAVRACWRLITRKRLLSGRHSISEL
jgi:hypothetical protein